SGAELSTKFRRRLMAEKGTRGLRLSQANPGRCHSSVMSFSARLWRQALMALVVSLVSFVACRDAGPPQAAEVLVADGDRQVALAGHPLPGPIVARVVDAAGEPAPGITLVWRADDGTLSPDRSVTDAQGQ